MDRTYFEVIDKATGEIVARVSADLADVVAKTENLAIHIAADGYCIKITDTSATSPESEE